MANLLVVVDYISQVISAGVMGLAHAHGVVCEIYIAVVAEEFWHDGLFLGAAVCI